MTISYSDQGTIRNDATFRARLGQACSKAALDIAGEDITGQQATYTDKRQRLAKQVLEQNDGGYAMFSQAVLANIGAGASTATDQSGITDGELDTAVAAVWDDVAGVRTGENT